MGLDRDFLDRCSFKSDLFKGKVVFVTGGAGTICRVQTEALVLLGADAAVVGRDAVKAERTAREISALRPGAKVIGIGGTDVRELKHLEAAVQRTVKELGKIDFVVAGAAGNFLADVNSLSANAFKSVVSIDLLGSFNTVKAAYSQLLKNKGAIIFVSATLHYYGVPLQSHVGAAKAGIDALSNALAVELGTVGVRSNCIAPGWIANTEGFQRLSNSHGEDELAGHIPLQRLGTTEDIANATIFLFSPAASYVTGTVLVVDGAAWHLGPPMLHEGLYPQALRKKLLQPPKL